METLSVQRVVCIRNQRPPLLEWEADVSEEFSWLQQFFFSFFMPKLWVLPHSIALPPAGSLFAVFTHPLLFISLSFDMLYVKLSLNQSDDSLRQWVCSSFSKRRKFFFSFTIPRPSVYPALDIFVDDVSGGKEWENKRCSCDRSPVCVSLHRIQCHAWLQFATLTESLSLTEREEEAQLAVLLCGCCFRWTLKLHQTLQ